MSYCMCDTDTVMYVIYFTLQVELIVAGIDSANPRIRCLDSGEEPDRRLSTGRPHFLKGIMRLKKGRGRSSTVKH